MSFNNLSNNNILIFDIETVADVAGYRRINNIDDALDDKELQNAMFAQRRAQIGTHFMAHHLHKVVAISLILKTKNKFALWSLGDIDSSESELIARFFNGMERYKPTLVSWNGGAFDLPVLQYRALFNGVIAKRYFEIGNGDRDYRFDNYLARFHWRHIDMMDVLSAFQIRASASLDHVAKLCGFPGKLDIEGEAVQSLYDDGKLQDIRNYCECDVLNTYLIYIRFEIMRGNITYAAADELYAEVRDFCANRKQTHLDSFLTAWQQMNNENKHDAK